jgi:hypothetical protein
MTIPNHWVFFSSSLLEIPLRYNIKMEAIIVVGIILTLDCKFETMLWAS